MNPTEKLRLELKKNPFLLAPMAGITDRAFRTFMREMGCGVVISELVSAHGLEFNSKNTRRIMEFEEIQRPYGVQIFGDSPEVLAKAAKMIEDFGADFVDLNFGCPVPKVVKKGGGSAILKDLDRVAETFKQVKAATALPLTVKIRTGWDENLKNADEVCKIAYNEGLAWVAIHGRTRAAGYSGWANWDYIADVKSKAQLPVIGNGDIASAAQAVQRLKKSGCDGVMIGRGCLKNPWIFRQSMRLWLEQNEVIAPHENDFLQIFVRLKDALERSTDEKIMILQLRKFASWFSSGYAGASNFRKTIFQADSMTGVMELINEFFSELSQTNQADTSGEAFLMGGHG